jgi:hypothetical protein
MEKFFSRSYGGLPFVDIDGQSLVNFHIYMWGTLREKVNIFGLTLKKYDYLFNF